MNTTFLKTPREMIGRYFFNKSIDRIQRNRVVHNLDTAKTIGFLYDATDEKEYLTVCDLVKSFQNNNKNIKALGYLNYPIIPHYCIPKLSFDYFTQKDINIFYIPTNSFIDDFVKKDFDILIDLSLKDFFPFHYISGISKAKFKVGKDGKNHSLYYDLMFKVDDEILLKDYIKQICNYLLILNKKNEQQSI